MPKILAFTFFISLLLFQVSCTEKKENKLITSSDSSLKFASDSTFGIYQIPSNNTILSIKYSGRKNLVGYFLRDCVQENFHSKLEENKDVVFSTIYSPKEKLYYRIEYSKTTKQVYIYKQISLLVNHYEEITFIDITPEKLTVNYDDYEEYEIYIKKLLASLTKKNIANHLNYEFTNEDNNGKLHFFNDGLCSYRIYDKLDSINENEQQVEVLGMWNYNNKKIYIKWKKNNILKLTSTIYKLENDHQLMNVADSTSLNNIW
jgi:hypothetical protein